MRSEPDLRPLLEALAAMDQQVLLPVVVAAGQALRFHRWAPGDDLVPGPLGTATPCPDRPTGVPEIMLVPLLAFDRGKRRLGYGGGFYDRTIAGLRASGRELVTIGIGYAELEIEQVPTDPWDQSLDLILTEQGWF
jgi:5-formyltetrahydrofolate cyclo-ligase